MKRFLLAMVVWVALCAYSNENGNYISERWYTPENRYHYQQWRKGFYSNEYTPFYIDFVDDYNQQTFFKLYGLSSFADFPNDKICAPIDIIENAVFNTKTIPEAKDFLRRYSLAERTTCIEYGLTPMNILMLYNGYN